MSQPSNRDRQRRFILVDQSLQNSGGHYLEYAIRVLREAKKQGYVTVLGTNKKCDSIDNSHIDIVDNAFTLTFFENLPADTKVVPARHRAMAILCRWKERLKGALAGTTAGVAYLAARQGTPRHLAIKSLDDLRQSRLARLQATTGFALAFAQARFHRLPRLLRWPTKLGLRVLGVVMIPLGLALFLPLAAIIGAKRFFRTTSSDGKKQEQFRDDLRSFFRNINPSAGDILFVPTLGSNELLGIASFLEKTKHDDISWRFLFRRNIYTGREPQYSSQIRSATDTSEGLFQFRKTADGADARFYTDTDALSEQYRTLGVFDFTTLPIPLDESNVEDAEKGTPPLKLTYIGDARTEKGYPSLSRCVRDVSAAGYTEQQLRFVIQSNFNIPLGEPVCRIAKTELTSESADFVKLPEGPFSSAEYAALLNEANILLIPYLSENYYARSSGIFAEAVAAGIPSVTTDKSWMSQELLSANQAYYRSCLETHKVSQSIRVKDVEQLSELRIVPRGKGEYAHFIVEIDQFAGQPGHYLDIRWVSSPRKVALPNSSPPYLHQYTIDLRIQKALGLIRLPGNVDEIRLKLSFDRGDENRHEPETLPIKELTLHQLTTRNTLPLFRGSALFSRPEDFSLATIELIEHYDAYLQAAQELKKRWTEFHSCETLVNMLTETRS
ncbi:glycosyltransferase [Oricola nitratireducens]|uniref:glycosyltransferase n=1 Tax=Oricola nitratireducens TaxID=2775868 RepID=UPI0018688E6D|nr:glycosyltransferase [Oricola nitratireducens]